MSLKCRPSFFVCRSIPNVGHRGRGLSNKFNGKLLVIPPSTKKLGSGICFPSAVFGPNPKSTPYNGTGQNKKGKLRLIRTATITGKSFKSGNTLNPPLCTSPFKSRLDRVPGLLSIQPTTYSGK